VAITWDVQIEVVDVATQAIRIAATRTDDAVTPPQVRTYRAVGKYDLATRTKQELLAHYAGIFWDLHQAEVSKETQGATLLGQAATALASALQAKEVI